jgi:hypothetical protein
MKDPTLRTRRGTGTRKVKEPSYIKRKSRIVRSGLILNCTSRVELADYLTVSVMIEVLTKFPLVPVTVIV